MLFAIAGFNHIYFLQLEVVQETLIHFGEIGLHFVSQLRKLFESLDCVFMSRFCQTVVAISFETLSRVDFVKCNKGYFKYWGFGQICTVFARCSSINF